MQDREDGRHPIAYLSRRLTKHEMNYTTYEQELLGVIEGLKQWQYLVLPSPLPCQVLTDHANLRALHNLTTVNGRLLRWANMLSEYDFTLSFRPGKENILADALSRRPDLQPTKAEQQAFRDNYVLPDTVFKAFFGKTSENEDKSLVPRRSAREKKPVTFFDDKVPLSEQHSAITHKNILSSVLDTVIIPKEENPVSIATV